MPSNSPYVTDDRRLADVVAAIQAMGVSGSYMRSFERWAEAITGDPGTAEHWRTVFIEHPEFFRLHTSRQKASLVWRLQLPTRYHVERGEMLSIEQVRALTEKEKADLSRPPLSPADIKTLIDAAVNIHSRAVEFKRESRWWVPLVASITGGLLGAMVGALLRGT